MDKMNPSATVEASTSTLPNAFVKTAEGNDFMNVGRNMVKLENVNVTFNTPCATGDGASEVRANAKPGPIITTKVFGIIGTLIGGIFRQQASETNPISSGNISQQSTPDCDARDHSEPRATFTEIADMISPVSLSASDTSNSTVSSLTQSSFPERYIRSMLECNEGHPLYEPEPENQEGVRVGDVGLITENGGFDFLFNVCPPSDIFINPDELPEGFEILRSPDILVKTHFQSETRLFNDGVKRTEEPDVKYTCSGPEGGVLELPSGATRFEAKNKLSFKRLATRHAENWYKYTVLTKDRDAPNGSLYIVTSCIKCMDWGIAVFDRPSDSQDYLRFITNEEDQNEQSKYKWKGSGSYVARVVAGSNDIDSPNQCVFLRGYKIMLPKDIWDNITNSQSTGMSSVTMSPYRPHPGNKPESPRQGDSSNQDGPSQSSADSSSGSGRETSRAAQNTCSRTNTSACVILYEYPKTSSAHPSDLINAMLLCQEPKAKVALTHDDDWCDLLQYHSQIHDSEALAKLSLLYTSNVDEYGCASLKRSESSDLNPGPIVTVVESGSDLRVTTTPENCLPIDGTATTPTHILPGVGDDSTLVQQDHPHPSNAITRSSTPHSQISHRLVYPTTSTVGSDVRGEMTRHHESLKHCKRRHKCACGKIFTRKDGLARHKKTCKHDGLTFLQQDHQQPFNATTGSSILPHPQTSHHLISSTTGTVGSDVDHVFSRDSEDVGVDAGVMNPPLLDSFMGDARGAESLGAIARPDLPTIHMANNPARELPSESNGSVFVQEQDDHLISISHRPVYMTGQVLLTS